MAIDINPQGLRPTRQGEFRSRRTEAAASRDDFAPPKERAHVNFIPAPESLATLIESAIAALRKGVYWDRGTILNLLV